MNSDYKGKCKDIIQALQVLPPKCIEFLDRVAAHHHSSRNRVYKLMLFSDVFNTKKKVSHESEYEAVCGTKLNPSQQAAKDEIVNSLGSFQRFFLSGMPGSGKTEVILYTIESVIKRGGQVLILMPEISLTTQWSDRFKKIFKKPPLIWSSKQPATNRRKIWNMAICGETMVVAGPRSALFLPFKSLSIIMVDEEHDPSLKQEVGVFYHGRNMAVLRAKVEECPVVLSSATPSMETLHNVEQGKYKCLSLKSRITLKPSVKLLNPKGMRKSGSWISIPLQEAMSRTLHKGQQVMLFINRRGYAPILICTVCGEILTCDNCSVNLVYHKLSGEVRCHYCHRYRKFCEKTERCPSCRGSFLFYSPAIEKIEEECRKLFPKKRIAAISSELKIQQIQDLVSEMADGFIDVMIGTQIIAKGYHFPNLTLVGVINGDGGLRGGELRAGESMFQMLMQLCGRVGREGLPGRVMIQTREEEDFLMKSLKNWDYEKWASMEIKLRKKAFMPPFSRLVSVIFTSLSMEKARNCGEKFKNKLDKAGYGKCFFGKAPATVFKIKGRYRYRLLLRFHVCEDYSKCLRNLDSLTDLGVKVEFDVDPYHIAS